MTTTNGKQYKQYSDGQLIKYREKKNYFQLIRETSSFNEKLKS